MFGGAGTALRTFGNKTFVTACPSSELWLETLKKLADRALDMGADGVFFDQLGYMSQVCWDESHGHKVPYMEVMGAKRKMLEKLRDHIKARNPKATFGIEWLSTMSRFIPRLPIRINTGFRAPITCRYTNTYSRRQ